MARNRVTGPGGHNALCDVCGLKYKAADLRRRWDGAMVCEWDFEPRHPQEFVRAKRDNPVLPFIRSDDGDGIDVGPDLNCDTFENEGWTAPALNAYLAALADTDNQQTLDIYKIKTVGGTIHIPDGLTVHIKCSLEIGT